MNPKR